MSPVARLIELSQRKHDRMAHIKRSIMRALDNQDLIDPEFDDWALAEYDQRFIKVDGREG